jgi:hypothetical protein
MMLRLALLAFCAVLAAPAPSHAFDLTGTWQGKQTCRGFDFVGLGAKFNLLADITVSQDGDEVFARIGDSDYAGRKIDDPNKPERGRLYLVRCTTDNVPGTALETDWDETADITVKTKATGSGTIKGFSTFIDIDGIGSCKWKFKRIGVVDPVLTGCSAPKP